MLILLLVSPICSLQIFSQEFIEGSSTFTISGWQDQSNNLITSKLNCAETKVGPLFGSFNSNIKKTYTNLPSHYEIILTLDILLVSFWASSSNYVKVLIDGQQIALISNIWTTTFPFDPNYCAFNNVYLVPQNQKLITIKQTVQHTSNSLLLQIQSDFSCSLLSLGFACQKLAIKNLIFYYSECHPSCLTCNGPNQNQCLTCPQGSPVSGSCSCTSGFISNNQCVASCPTYYVAVNGYCSLECSLNCQQCSNGDCLQCEPNYYNMNGKCFSQCPSNGLLSGSLCQELTELSQYESNYIDQMFTKGLLGFPQNQGTLTYSGGTLFSMLTGQIYSIYNNKVILGGLGVWADGYFQKSYNSIPPHNKLRIYLTAYFIDSWLSDQFQIFVDGVSVFSEQVNSLTLSSNTMFRDTFDKIENISLTVSHNSSTLLIKFQSSIPRQSTLASLGLTDIYILSDNCDVSCIQCSKTVCITCGVGYNLINQKCIQCGPTYNRQALCTCMVGYYDDGINQNCQPCPSNCVECSNLNTCSSCKTNYIGQQCQNCVNGFYLDLNSKCQNCMDNCKTCISQQICQICQDGYWVNNGICTQCNPLCTTCISDSYCLSCQSGYALSETRLCVECVGNNMVLNNYCISCQSKCNGCSQFPSQCVQCSSNRSNPPVCLCQDGYYEFNLQCYKCPDQCLTCQQDGLCTQCQANRINSPKCECPTPGISRNNIGIAWCTSCDLGVAYVQFSNDLRSLFIDFGYPVQDQQLICDQLFLYDTYSLLGSAPICQVVNAQLIINLDTDSTLLLGSELQMNPSYLKLQNCNRSFQKIINLKVNGPENPIQPQVLFNTTSIIYNYCVNSYFQIGDIINDGKRGLNYEGWYILQATDQDLAMNLINFWNSKQNYRLWMIPQNMFLLNQRYTFGLNYSNFIGVYGQSYIVIQSLTQWQARIMPQFNLPMNAYSYEQVLIYSDPTVTLCGSSVQILSKNLSLNISNLEFQYITQNLSLINETFQQYTFIANTTYNLIINAQIQYIVDAQQYSISSDFSYKLKILLQSWIFQIDGGNQVIGYQQPVNLNILAINPNVQTQTSYNLQVKWHCQDSITGQQCLNSQGSLLLFNNSMTQHFEPNIFAPYQIIQIQAQSTIDGNLYQSMITVTFIDSNLPQVSVLINNQSKYQMMNYYDEIYVQLFYPLQINPDNLYFSAQIINDIETVQFRFFNYGFKFRIKDKIKEQNINIVKFKFLIYNPDYFSPSVSSIQIKFNTPPQNCLINTNFSSNGSLVDVYQIDVLECYDEEMPLQFMFVIYDDLSEFVSDWNLGLIVQGVIIQNYTFNNQLITHLPKLSQLILQVFVKDSSNGISNFTQFLNQTIQVNDTQAQLDFKNLLQMQKQNAQEICSTIITILKHAESNQIIINKENINGIQQKLISLLNNRIIKDQITQILMMLYQQQNYIKSDPIIIENNLNYFSEQINQLYLDMKQEFQYSDQQQYDRDKELNKLYSISRVNRYIIIIDSLYDLSLKLNYDESLKNKVNEKVMKCIDDLTEAVLLTQLVNDDKFQIMTKLISLQTQKLTQSMLVDQIGSVIDNHTIIGRNLQEVDNYFLNYTYTLQEFKENPLSNTTNFKDKYKESEKLYKPKLTENDQTVNISQPVSFSFSNQSQNQTQECVIQINDIWSADACSRKLKSDQVICVCEQISPVTLAEALIQIKSQFLNLFTEESIQKITKFPFYAVLFTYIILFYTVFYVWFLYYGNKLDNSQNFSQLNEAKIYPEQFNKQNDYLQENYEVQENIVKTDGSQGSKILRSQKIIKQGSIQVGRGNAYDKGQDANSTINDDYQKSIFIQERMSKKMETNMQDEINEVEPPSDNRSHLSRTPNSVIKYRPLQFSKRKIHQIIPKETNTKEEQEVVIQNTELQPKGLIPQMNQGKTSLFGGFLYYYKNWHIIFGLFYRYSQTENRKMRSSLIYISIMGQICILTVFGSNLNLNTILALSLLQTIFGFIYKKTLSYALNSKNQIIKALGGNLTIMSGIFFFYVILVSICNYESALLANIWAISYLCSFILDYFIYSTIFMIFIFTLCFKLFQRPNLYVIYLFIYLFLENTKDYSG